MSNIPSNIVVNKGSTFLTQDQGNALYLTKNSLVNYIGNVGITGNVTISGSSTLTIGAFVFNTSGFWRMSGTSSTVIIQNSSATKNILVFSNTSAQLSSANSILDDGATGAMKLGTNTGNSNMFQVTSAGGGATNVFNVNSITSAITTKNNTIDDGSTGLATLTYANFTNYSSALKNPCFFSFATNYISIPSTIAWQRITFSSSGNQGGTVDTFSSWAVPFTGVYNVSGSLSGNNPTGANSSYSMGVAINAPGTLGTYTAASGTNIISSGILGSNQFNMTYNRPFLVPAGYYITLVFRNGDTGGNQVYANDGFIYITYSGFNNLP